MNVSVWVSPVTQGYKLDKLLRAEGQALQEENQENVNRLTLFESSKRIRGPALTRRLKLGTYRYSDANRQEVDKSSMHKSDSEGGIRG